MLVSARDRRPNGVLEPFKAYLNARFTEAEGQVSGTRLFLEIRERGYLGSRQVVRKHLAALRAGTAEPVRADIPSPRKITPWIMCPRDPLTDSQEERLLHVRLACPDISRGCDLARAFADLVRHQRAVEGFGNRVKTLKRAMYGRASFELLRTRFSPSQQRPLRIPPRTATYRGSRE